MAAMSDFLENKLIDAMFRGQTFTFPTTVYIALLTATASDTGGGTEVTTTSSGYARVGVACSLANFSGTQGVSTTVASTGTSGTTYNNAVITFGAPTAAWGTVTHFAIYDAATAGNLLFFGALSASKVISAGNDAPTIAIGALSVQFDN